VQTDAQAEEATFDAALARMTGEEEEEIVDAEELAAEEAETEAEEEIGRAHV
jgi:hypothetical protein